MLLKEHGKRLHAVPRKTIHAAISSKSSPHMALYKQTPPGSHDEMTQIHTPRDLAELSIPNDHSTGIFWRDLEEVWIQSKVALIEGSLELIQGLNNIAPTVQVRQ